MSALDCLLQCKKFNQALEVRARYKTLMQDENKETTVYRIRHPRDDQRDESICYQAAYHYLKLDQPILMKAALEQLPETNDRITFLQKNGRVYEAAQLMVTEGKSQEAAEMIRSTGNFMQAVSFTSDAKFAAECYLITARTCLQKMKRKEEENADVNQETIELFEGPLQRAAQLYRQCGDLNGQAEVKFVRARHCKSVNDLHEAGFLYYKALNYTGAAECINLLIDIEKDGKFPRNKSINTIYRLLSVILALHKKCLKTNDSKVITMCEIHFGLVDTDDVNTRRAPRRELVRFASLQYGREKQSDEITVEDAHNAIKNHLYDVAASLIERVWVSQKRVSDRYEYCFRHLSGVNCEGGCQYYHGQLSRQHFADRFYALCTLIHLDRIVAGFFENLLKESAQVAYKLQRRFSATSMRFKACRWLEELLFPDRGQLGRAYVLSEKDAQFLRREERLARRITEYAKWLWSAAGKEEKWSSSDLFIRVSNLMHLASAPLHEIYSLLSQEERAYEKEFSAKKCKFYPAFLEDKSRKGRYDIFTKLLENSREVIRKDGDIIRSSRDAVKRFLSVPARRRNLPYPSIAHVLMILEHNFTLCLMLYSRLTKSYVCLPESYLSIIMFWDIVTKFNQGQNTTYNLIQQQFSISTYPAKLREMLDRACEQMQYMVALVFGGVSARYNIIRDAFRKNCVNSGETERALILGLVMLCNCDHLRTCSYLGQPEPCETVIRREFLKVCPSSFFPDRLNTCLLAVQASQGVADVVKALEQLLDQEPRKEQLFDVTWDEMKMKDYHVKCQLQHYPQAFCFDIQVKGVLDNSTVHRDSRESEQDHLNEFNDDVQDSFDEDYEANNPQLDDYERKTKILDACVTIQNAFRAWKEKKELERIKKDPVEYRFRRVKLDKFSCTICNVLFQDLGSEISLSEETYGSVTPSGGTKPTGFEISQQNSFEQHSREESHFVKDRQFKDFKNFYKRSVYSALSKAEMLRKKMELSSDDCCKLDLERLEKTIERLKTSIKKVEGDCAWDQLSVIRKALGEMDKQTSVVEMFRKHKGIEINEKIGERTFSKGHTADQDKEFGTDMKEGDFEDVDLPEDMVPWPIKKLRRRKKKK